MSGERLVAIHQPNFFPWLGYFDKIRRADVFVVLDDVQFPKSGAGNWSNRVKLVVGGQPTWVGVPVISANRGLQRICEIEIAETVPWRTKINKTLRMHYARAAHFSVIFPWLEPLIMNPTHSLVEYNMAGIRAICEVLNLDRSKIRLSSTLAAQGQATDLLISLVRSVGGTTYLSGDGAGGYQEEHKYADAGLRLVMQRFEHPIYAQRPNGVFLSGLSSIDALMHCGFKGVQEILYKRP
jgi:hypothetical protein